MLSKTKKIHFIGIGGIGMSGIAELLHNLKFKISGSDIKNSERVKHLKSLGIKININHSKKNICDPDIVVYSSAVNRNNVEIIESEIKSIPIIRRAEMLGELLKIKKTSIAISGTHGKTTTCSMLGSILINAKLNPTLVIGGIVNNFGSNSISGEGDIIVVEADEYDKSFLSLKPTIAVINNIDFEHSDCYKDLNDLEESFIQFANSVPFYGLVGICIDDMNVLSISEKIKRPCKNYGTVSKNGINAKNFNFSGFNSSFDLFEKDKFIMNIKLPAPGHHNICNALAAITVSREIGLSYKSIAKGLLTYSGVKRRLEIVKTLKNGSIIMDDYAHHPIEVEASISAIKSSFKNRLITIFQPHLFSRTLSFYNEFAKALSLSDVTILTDLYPAREKPINGVSSKLIFDEMCKTNTHQIHMANDEEIKNLISSIYEPGDIIITMGAGDVYKYKNEIYSAIS